MTRVPLVLWLTAVWVFLWEAPSVANFVSGLALSSALVFLYPARGPVLTPVSVVGFVRFAAYFLWKLVEASAVLAWEVVTPRNSINEGIVAVQIRGASDALTTIVANSISLTPGTLTLEVDRDPTVLYVHVLHLRSIDEVRADILELEAHVIDAFGTAEERRALANRPTATEEAP